MEGRKGIEGGKIKSTEEVHKMRIHQEVRLRKQIARA